MRDTCTRKNCSCTGKLRAKRAATNPPFPSLWAILFFVMFLPAIILAALVVTP